MKQKNWLPIQIKKALSLSQKIDHSFSGISINSRTLKKNNLFLPLKGKNHEKIFIKKYCSLFKQF